MPTIDAHDAYPLAAAFSPSLQHLYYGDGATGAIYVMDVESGSLVDRWDCHRLPITALGSDADGNVLSASYDGSAAIRSSDGSLLQTIVEHDCGIHSLDVRGEIIALGCFDGTVYLCNAGTVYSFTAHDAAVTAVVILDDTTLFTASRDKTVKRWDIPSAEFVYAYDAHEGWVTKLALDRNTRRVYSAGEDALFACWDIDGSTLVWRHSNGYVCWGMDVAANGEFAITGSNLQRWTLPDGNPSQIKYSSAERVVCIASDSERAALGADSGSLDIVDIAQERVIHSLARKGDGCLCAVANDAGVVVTGHNDGLLKWSTGAQVPAHAAMAYALARVDENRFTSIGFDGRMCLWSFEHSEVLAEFAHPDQFVFSTATTDDGSLAISAGSNAFVVWNLADGSHVICLEDTCGGDHNHGTINGIGTLIASVGDEGVVRVWDMNGTEVHRVTVTKEQISDIAFTPDDASLVLAWASGHVSRLDLDSSELRPLHAAHEDWIRSVNVTPDGRYAISSSQNHITAAYDLEVDAVASVPDLMKPLPAAAIDRQGTVYAIHDGVASRVTGLG